MNETILRQRRALRRAVVRSVIVVATCALASPFAVFAQATAAPPPAARPLLLAGAKNSGPLHEAATVGILIPLRSIERGSDFGSNLFGYRGVIVEAGAGAEGFELAAGWGRRWKPRKGPALFGEDVMATAFLRRSDAAPDATYVGSEVGLTMMLFRVSVGAATRVSGAQQADRTIFTWGIGFNIGR
jgi:hypothetical protein